MRPETIKILENSTGRNFSDIGNGNIFLDMSPKGIESRDKLLGLHQNKKLFNTKRTSNPIKKWAEDMSRHFPKEDVQRPTET